ncbi:hypothetical protein CEXT_253591 [Caerostris extrusa]|uniref:Uncharacterized protein n=1 Tax=Caerostris extrusa TaxID=172846 RepID=A0AAV4WG65_CAEEX|nr:hypothetical protein CEXT_253591 [Caerostris extrusa]
MKPMCEVIMIDSASPLPLASSTRKNRQRQGAPSPPQMIGTAVQRKQAAFHIWVQSRHRVLVSALDQQYRRILSICALYCAYCRRITKQKAEPQKQCNL